jgi:uncharacterized protein
MGRLLVLVVLVVVAVWLIRRALRASARNPGASSPAGNADSSNNKSEALVRCANCGVLLPRAEARLAGGALYCTEEHARLGPGPR